MSIKFLTKENPISVSVARDSERMSCEESAIFFGNLAYIPHIRKVMSK